MLKLVVIQSGVPDREIVVSGDSATLGRVSSCDVVIEEPFVSKQHLQILHGTVVVDLGSSNGTFIDGERVTHGVLLRGRTVEVSQNGVEVRVEAAQSEEDGAGNEEVETLRSEFALLEAESARLKRELAVARDTADQDELIARIRGENESLRERLESVKAELEEREVEDGGSVQAKLAMQRVENVRELNEKLQDEVDRLQAELDERDVQVEVLSSSPEAVPQQIVVNAELMELRQQNAELAAALEAEREAARQQEKQTKLVRKLREELESLRAADPGRGSSDQSAELEACRSALAEARAHAAELEGRLGESSPAPGANVSDLFFKLQSENTELRRKVAGLEEGGGGGGEPARRDMKTVKELMEARLKITALESQVSNLKVTSVQELSDAKPKPRPKHKSEPSPPTPAGGQARQVLQAFAESDIEGLVRPSGGPAEVYLLIESIRLLRHVERVVTRVAGDLIQLFQLQTMLPDTVGTYRGLVSDLLENPDDDDVRHQLVDYFETLGRWLVAAIGSHRQAAVLFAGKIKDDLSEKSLVAADPLPPYARVPMLAGSELWRRVQAYLVALSPDAIDEGIDSLAREQAQRILNEAS